MKVSIFGSGSIGLRHLVNLVKLRNELKISSIYAYDSINKRNFLGKEELDHLAFVKEARKEASKMYVKDEMLKRAVNVGFSGGEKKRFEILQMAMLKPTVSILDETDSGLDVDALKIVSDGVNAQRNNDNAIVVITHYQRLLDYIIPDFVHILSDGVIIKSGGPELALEVEKNGYSGLINAA